MDYGDDEDEESQKLLRRHTPSPADVDATTTTLPPPPPRLKLLTSLQLLFLCFYSIGFGALWTFLLVVAVPQQVAALVDVNNTTKGKALGLVMLCGGFISAVQPPIVGYLSDRTRTRFGRRKPYMVVGSLCLVIATLFLPSTTTLPSFILVYVLMQFCSNISSSANLGLMPDLVPQEQLGRASGMMGAMGALGQLCGASSGLFVSRLGLQTVYTMLCALYLVTTLLTVFGIQEKTIKTGKDELPTRLSVNTGTPGNDDGVGVEGGSVQSVQSIQSDKTEQDVHVQCLHTFTDALTTNADFRWVFITRLFYNMGIYSVQEFLQYYVKDVIPLEGVSATTEVSLLFVPLLLGALVSAYLSGKLSDQWGGQRKIFIYTSGIAQVLICLIFMFNTSVGFAAVLALLFGVASGAYAAVDFAMVLDVLPTSGQNVARDLGVWHVSLVLPQLLSTPLSGYVLDCVRSTVSVHAGYAAIFLLSAFWFGLSTVLVVFIKSVK